MNDSLNDNLINAGENMPIRVFTEDSYLNYSMYVIMDRALPNIIDGLKPVQRRIIYAMSELGLSATSKHKKSSRTVGDVLGKFHPHGDSACYEAMVLMAQSFSYRYPLIDGHGNWGSPDDPKSFAAMRYTESRLSKYSEFLLQELPQGAADWIDNFDATLKEPSFFPARLPHILLNGVTGIAVGMTTDIPPHNVKEVINACLALLKKKTASLDDVLQHINGPDFPTGAKIITSKSEITSIYKNGKGSIKARSLYSVEDKSVVIHALPYQVTVNKVIQQIVSQMQNKKLQMVVDVRDESSHEDPIRLVVFLKNSKVDPKELMMHLFATTDLERSYRVNFNMIGLNGNPEVKPLVNILREWLDFRLDSVTKRLNYKLLKLNNRTHLLEGLIKVYNNLDKIIDIIRKYDDAKERLMKKFSLSDKQVSYVLEIRLRQLAKLEEQKINDEMNQLTDQIEDIKNTLSSEANLKKLISKELKEDLKKYGDDRITLIEEGSYVAKTISEEKLISSSSVSIIVSKKGFIRSSKGRLSDFSALNYRSGDEVSFGIHAKTNFSLCLIGASGKSFSLKISGLPDARGYGDPLAKYIDFLSGDFVVSGFAGTKDQSFAFILSSGYGFVTTLGDTFTKKKQGKSFLNIKEGENVIHPVAIDESAKNSYLLIITSDDYMVAIPSDLLPVFKKGRGQKLINIPSSLFKDKKSYITQAFFVSLAVKNISFIVKNKPQDFSIKDISLYVVESLARRGKKLPVSLRGVTKVVLS